MAARKPSAGEDDSYWNDSVAEKAVSKKNIFDDNVNLNDAKSFLSLQKLDDIDFEDDSINFDGSSAKSSTTVGFQSARYRPTSAAGDVRSTPPVSLQSSRSASQPESDTAAGTESRLCPLVVDGDSDTAAGFGTIKLCCPRDATTMFHPSPTSIQDAISTSSTKHQPTITELCKLEAENLGLKRMLEAAKKGDVTKIPTQEAIRKLILGQTCSLERYKSKEEKLQLLDLAISSNDGNTIIVVILFLRNTLKTPMFNLELMCRPRATQHYINYLQQINELENLMDLLAMLGRNEEASYLKYRQTVCNKDADVATKLRSIKTCYQTHFQSCSSLAFEASLINEQISLLERQIPIEGFDLTDAEKGAPQFKEIPIKSRLTDTSVMATLYYCCLYHYELPENHLASPQAIRKAHRLTDKQFVWMALGARARLRRWKEIEALFVTKGWLGGTKMRAVIGFDRVVCQLSKVNAPREELNKYCNLIDPLERRVEVGKKYACHESVIETLVNMKDRLQLSTYQSQLKYNSQEWFVADGALRNSSIKWKN